MSIILTVFTSEASINRGKMEMQTLRAKGASYNQVISSLMMESILLTFPGFVLGVLLAIYLAPLLGSMVGLLTINPNMYALYLNHTTFQFTAIVVAGMISMFLPGTFIFQIFRLIDIVEIGQPMTSEIPDEVETVGIRNYIIA
ncbi:MAG: FtsX-like permease family protein [Candidatus Thorarchaeota archaeon]|nr:FtsX-like permease family protein [Candidatus Thorarchaeota archaeon]